MRLIDADKILQETYGVVIKDMFHMTEKVEVVSAIDIKEAPTIKAIPVKWLRQWFAENRFKFYDDNDNIYLVADIEEMLLEWEKENERP